MAINGRRKGSKAERIASKVISKWSGKGFSKTPASGGLNWKKANVAGDIVCTTEGHYCPFVFEVKSYAKIDFSHLIHPTVKNVDILSYWTQAERDAIKVKKIPMLMMRYNGLPSDFFFVVLSYVDYKLITITCPMDKGAKTLRYNSNQKQTLIVIPSTEIFKLPYKEVRKIAKTIIKKRYASS